MSHPAAQPTISSVENCSITGTVEALGDTWSILVIRELFYGVRRFNDMQTELGISRSVLTDRLARLIRLDVVRTEPYQETGDRMRKQYRLTPKGMALLHVVIALMEWGDEFLNERRGGVTLHDRETGDPIRLELRTAAGKRVEAKEIEIRLREDCRIPGRAG